MLTCVRLVVVLSVHGYVMLAVMLALSLPLLVSQLVMLRVLLLSYVGVVVRCVR